MKNSDLLYIALMSALCSFIIISVVGVLVLGPLLYTYFSISLNSTTLSFIALFSMAVFFIFVFAGKWIVPWFRNWYKKEI